MDWNNDGKLDLLSGCYWSRGEKGAFTYLFEGSGTTDFAAAEPLKTSTGRPYTNLLERKVDGEDLVRQNICTHQFAVDYDDDGDLDLINGCFGPQFFLVENTEEGLANVGTLLSIKNTGHHSAPHLVDWDGDGDLDLLSGAGEGGAVWFENTGTRAAPLWADAQELIARSSGETQNGNDPDSITPSNSSRIWVHDWNNDGRLDILLGDNVTIQTLDPDLSPEDLGIKAAELDAQFEALKEDDRVLAFVAARTEAEGDIKAIPETIMIGYSDWTKDYQNITNESKQLSATQKTGHVWLYLQKAG